VTCWVRAATSGIPPFGLMDRVGLDVVLDIEEHYASMRPGLPEEPRNCCTGTSTRAARDQ
jgi:3-hydroxybutyryl-CoA dehydrogenase